MRERVCLPTRCEHQNIVTTRAPMLNAMYENAHDIKMGTFAVCVCLQHTRLIKLRTRHAGFMTSFGAHNWTRYPRNSFAHQPNRGDGFSIYSAPNSTQSLCLIGLHGNRRLSIRLKVLAEYFTTMMLLLTHSFDMCIQSMRFNFNVGPRNKYM